MGLSQNIQGQIVVPVTWSSINIEAAQIPLVLSKSIVEYPIRKNHKDSEEFKKSCSPPNLQSFLDFQENVP